MVLIISPYSESIFSLGDMITPKYLWCCYIRIQPRAPAAPPLTLCLSLLSLCPQAERLCVCVSQSLSPSLSVSHYFFPCVSLFLPLPLFIPLLFFKPLLRTCSKIQGTFAFTRACLHPISVVLHPVQPSALKYPINPFTGKEEALQTLPFAGELHF